MKKLRTQFDALLKERSTAYSPGCSTCCCCCCVATTVGFSIATSRYLYLKSKAHYAADLQAVRIYPALYAVYGLLSYVLAVALMFMAGAVFQEAGYGLVVGSALFAILSGFVFHKIKVHPFIPLLLLGAYGLVSVGEIFAWAKLGLIK